MKRKQPTFMLVRRADSHPASTSPASEDAAHIGSTRKSRVSSPSSEYERAERAAKKSIASNKQLISTFERLNPDFRKTLVNSFVSAGPFRSNSNTVNNPQVGEQVTSITNDLARRDQVLKVGILDLGAWVGALPDLLTRLNEAQDLFTLFEIQAPIPAGLLKTKAAMAQWISTNRRRKLSNNESESLEKHFIADDFEVVGLDIRTSMGLDLLVGLAPAMVAGIDNGKVFWNHFASVSNKVILLSTTDLREFSALAGRPFEVAIGILLVSTLLVAINEKLDYHDDTGCIFDYNPSRVSIVDTLKAPKIDADCLSKMTTEQRDAAVSMVNALKKMRIRKSR